LFFSSGIVIRAMPVRTIVPIIAPPILFVIGIMPRRGAPIIGNAFLRCNSLPDHLHRVSGGCMSIEFIFRLIGMVVFAIVGWRIGDALSTQPDRDIRFILVLLLAGAALGLLIT